MARRGLPPTHASFPNLAPMIDVVMVILIFFMLGTSFAASEGALRTQLPAQIGPGGGARIQFLPMVRIDLTPDASGGGCRVRVMGRELEEHTFASLTAMLKSKVAEGADPSGRILISSDPRVTYQHVISALDACVRAGYSNVQLAVGSGRTPSLRPDRIPPP